MAGMKDGWMLAAVAVFPAFVAAAVAAGTCSISQRLVAIQLLSSLSTMLLIVLSFAFGQSSSIDLALSAALLVLPGTLLLALFLERWI